MKTVFWSIAASVALFAWVIIDNRIPIPTTQNSFGGWCELFLFALIVALRIRRSKTNAD